MQGHTSCVTEHQKYALLATKPGGAGAKGAGAQATAAPSGPTGLSFLATKPPWVCSCCNVTCTSRDTLEGHASGKKHQSKVRTATTAAAAAAAPPVPEAAPVVPAAAPPSEPAAAAALPDVKWKKLAVSALGEGRLKRKAFVRTVVAAAREKHAELAGVADEVLTAALDERIGGKRFRTDGKFIELAGGEARD